MEILSREMPLDYELLDAGDLHIGTINCHYDGIDEMINWVKRKPNRYLNLKGDIIEAITPKDKRFSMRSVDLQFKSPTEQADYFIERAKPIADNIIGMCLGNHELMLLDTIDIIEYITKRLHIKKLAYGAGIYKFVSLRKGKIKHKMLFCHGTRHLPYQAKDPIQREANRKAAQKRILEELGFSDCVYNSQGHHHQLICVKPTVERALYLTDDGTHIKQHYRVRAKQNVDYIPPESRFFCGTGSFRKSYTPPGSHALDYSEGRYSPSELGCVRVIVKNGEVIDAVPWIA